MAERAKNPSQVFGGMKLPRLSKKRRLLGAVTALDVDGSILRVVTTTPRGSRLAVSRIAAEKMDLPEDSDRPDPQLMGIAIKKALERLRLRPGSVVMGIPRASVVLRTLALPMLDDQRDLASVVHFQISKDLPFRLDEAVIDFKVRRAMSAPASKAEDSEKPGDGAAETKTEASAPTPKIEVLVAAVKREIVEFYQATAAVAGLKLVALGLVSHANARCLAACRVAEGNEAIALVSLRPDEVGIDVVAEDMLLFSRGTGVHARLEGLAGTMASETFTPEDGSEENEASPPGKEQTLAEAVTIEVVRSLHSYSGLEPQRPVSRVVVVGATEQEPQVVEALGYRLNLACTWLDVAGELELPKAAREHAAGSISAIGLALGVGDPGGLPFDFLSPKRPAVKRNLKRIRIMMALAGALAVFLSVTSVRTYLIKQRLKEQAAVEAQLKDAESKRPIYRAMITQASGIRDWVKSGANWLEHYAYLTSILPSSEEIYLTSISVSGQGTIRMAVQARSGEILAKLDKQLRAAGYDVKPIAITPGNDRFGYDFRTSVELMVPEKMKIDLSKVRPPPRPADDGSLDPAVLRKARVR